MIKFSDGGLKDLLPPILKYDPEVIAFSYAVQRAMEKMLKFGRRTMMYAAIDEQSEEMLDYMAVESRAQYYEETMDVETKREILKNSLAWYMKAGTQESVDELIQTAFGEGESVPWYEFEEGAGTPGTFDVKTNARLEADMYEKFMRIIEKAKNQSSVMRYIIVEHTAEEHYKTAIAGTAENICTIANDITVDNQEQAVFVSEHISITGESEAIDSVVVGGIDTILQSNNERSLIVITEASSATYVLETMDDTEVKAETSAALSMSAATEMTLEEKG